MLRKMFRVALAATSTVLFIPYAIAFVAELIYGKPSKSHNRFLRALNPKRVYAFNYSLIRELKYLKYIKLYFAWTDFYKNETIDRLIKDIEYGQNRNALDVYKGRSRYSSTGNSEALRPVIIFLYGGGWSSGDKNIYGLLCSNLATLFNCIVVCPNYTLYPRGFVDDMVQDVSDVLQWVQNNAIIYEGDKNRVVLIGHSAGAHLATLTIGEICKKYLDNNPEYLEETNFPMINDTDLFKVHLIPEPIPFHATHFNGDDRRSQDVNVANTNNDNNKNGNNKNDNNGDIPVKESEQQMLESAIGASMVIVHNDYNNNGEDDDIINKVSANIILEESKQDGSGDENGKNWIKVGKDGFDENGVSLLAPSGTNLPTSVATESFIVVGEENNKVGKKDEDVSVVADVVDVVGSGGSGSFLAAGNERKEPEVYMTEEQRQLHQQQLQTEDDNVENGNLIRSIKLVIGLAGVYDIEEHYGYQTSNGMENFSNMSRVMYDNPQQFHIFSPFHVLSNLPEYVRLPPIHLYHGTNDSSVLLNSSLNFGAALSLRKDKTVQVRLLNGCDHVDIMMDMMDKERVWFGTMVMEIKKGLDKYL